MEYNVADLIEGVVDRVPDRDAVVCADARRTYGELDERANRLAHHLAAQGVGPGDHVGIHAHNSVEFVESMLGCYKLRAVPININYRYVEDELLYLFDNADLVALIHERSFTRRIQAIRDRVPGLRHTVVIDDESEADSLELSSVPYEEALAEASPKRDFGPRSDQDIYILYTGGTTGMPKGVVWHQRDVIHALGGAIDHTTGVPVERPEDLPDKSLVQPAICMLPIAPLMHGAAQWGTLASLFVGNKTVLHPSFDAETIWQLIEQERVNIVAITGDAMARPLVETLQDAQGRWDLSSLIALASTAAIFSPVLKDQFKELLPNLVISDSVGSTETGFHGTSLYQVDAKKGEGAGITVTPGRDTVVVNQELTRKLEPGSDELGKLARGGNIPIGYYKDPGKTEETFLEIEGVRYAVPGDFAKVAADGSITLLGRGSVCINSGGEKIFPEEVEAVLKSHADVFDAVVVGVPDERWGEKVTAVVQIRPGRTVELSVLDSHCRERIAGFKIPRALHRVEEIQRQPSGKPDYPWARREAIRALGLE